MSHKRETPRIGVLVRFEPEDLAAIDKARGEQSRQSFIATAALDRAQQPQGNHP